MNAQDFDELAGRIDGICHALLRVVSLLEMAQLIDAPRVAAAWQGARPEHLATNAQLQASRQVLHQLASLLHDASLVRAASQGSAP